MLSKQSKNALKALAVFYLAFLVIYGIPNCAWQLYLTIDLPSNAAEKEQLFNRLKTLHDYTFVPSMVISVMVMFGYYYYHEDDRDDKDIDG